MTAASNSSNKRIALNTVYLYIRMGILMLVKLYTSRVLLQTLGVDNYGAWIAVASFIVVFSFIGSPLITATQRFLNYEMGIRGGRLRHIFCTSLLIFVFAAIVLVLILESLGLWFINSEMTYGNASLGQVNILYQFSVVTLVVNLIRLPYEAVIIANEKMSFYAKISVVEGVLLLLSVFVLKLAGINSRLALYGGLCLISQSIIFLCYLFYCKKRFEYVKAGLIFNKNLAKQIGAFSGWNFFGAMASMSAVQGVNIIINIFYGVVFNATFGIANQVRAAVGAIVDNLQKASNPQIVKSYAANERDRVIGLVTNVGKFSFLLVFMISVPVMLNMKYLLHLWLGNKIPPEAVEFCNLALIQLLFVCFSAPMDTAVFATGKIRNYQLTLSAIILLNIVLTYMAFRFGYSPIYAMYVKVIVEALVLLARIIFLKYKIGLSLINYLRQMILPCAIIIILSLITIYIGSIVFTFSLSPFLQLLLSFGSFVIICLIYSWAFAFSKPQRKQAFSVIRSKLNI